VLVLETWTTPAALTAAGKTKVRTRLLKKAPRLGGWLTEEVFAALAAQTVVVTGTNAAGFVLPRRASRRCGSSAPKSPNRSRNSWRRTLFPRS
jgi:hypothetical protein